MSSLRRPEGGARDVLRLAVPALPVLAAEPLYVLVDTAVVGRLGAVPLAGLAVAGVLFSQVTTQLNFLSYGTTARASRLHGAGRRSDAVAEGVQATWLALAVGLLVLLAGQLLAGPVSGALAGAGTPAGDAVAAGAESWLRIALFGAPLVLVTLAGNGWTRGVQDTVRPLRYVIAGNGLSALLCPLLVFGAGGWDGWGLEGSAVANVVAQTVTAGFFLRALYVERASATAGEPIRLRPVPSVLRAQAVLGRDLLLRTLGFQACFLSATAVAARFGAPSVAAHQIVLQLWVFQALVLDSVAIAAQALVGSALGSGPGPGPGPGSGSGSGSGSSGSGSSGSGSSGSGSSGSGSAPGSAGDGAARARAVAARVTRYGLVLGVGFGILFAALYPFLPGVFTSDVAVLAVVPMAWWFFAGLQPIAGVVFALDGVLLGAGDAAFLRTTTLIAAVGGFLPLIWASLVFDWGLAGIWAGLTAFMVIRLVAVGRRGWSGKWAVTGAVRA